jgi:CHASE1-domain containing sensor protein
MQFEAFLTRWREYRHLLPLLSAAVVGLGLTVLAWQATLAREKRHAEVELSGRANSQALILQNGFDEYISRVNAVRALFESSSDVARQEFSLFTDQLLRGQSAIVRVAWLPRVGHEMREAHEMRGRAEGLPDYRIHDAGSLDPAPQRDYYFPLFFSNGTERSSKVLGLDVRSEPKRRATVHRAMDSGGITTSPVITLGSATGTRDGFFVLLPVYQLRDRTDASNTKPENLIGFVSATFRIEAVIETILTKIAEQDELDFYLFERPGNDLLYFHSSRSRDIPTLPLEEATLRASPHWISDIRIGDRDWSVVVAPISYSAFVHPPRAQMVLGWGVLLTGLLLAHMWTSARHARRLELAKKNLKKARMASRTQNMRFQAALSNMSQGLVLFDRDRRVVICNERYMEIYGLAPEQVKPGTPVRTLIEHRLSLGMKTDLDPNAYVRWRTEGPVVAENAFQEFADGRTIAYAVRPMADGGGVATHEDVTDQRRTEARIRHMALHDALTDLPNRTLPRQRLEQALKTGKPVAALWLDLDRFKEVNDTWGHAIGDELLKVLAKRLQNCVREEDTAARLGGDEFAVIQVRAQPAAGRDLTSCAYY